MKKTTEIFKNQLKKVQPNLQLIGEYVNTDTKLEVVDELGIHYLSKPFKLLQNRKPSIRSAINPTEAFVKKANSVHGGKYKYNSAIYVDSHILLTITCNNHGDFKMSPHKHLLGQGCKLCLRKINGLKKRSNTQEFINKAKLVHKNFYSYKKVKYTTSCEKVEIICPFHGSFYQQPTNHLYGQGCKKCGSKKISESAKDKSSGWSFSKWYKKIKNNPSSTPRLYLLECFNQEEKFLKVGITMHTIKKRYPGKYQLPYNYNVVFELVSDANKVFSIEKKIKKEYGDFLYHPKLKFNGCYECFDVQILHDILNFINNAI